MTSEQRGGERAHVSSSEITLMLRQFTESGKPNGGISFEDKKPEQALAMLSLKCLGDMQMDASRKQLDLQRWSSEEKCWQEIPIW